MSSNQEIALAVLLWKSFRQQSMALTAGGQIIQQAAVNEEVAEASLGMAKKLGVKEEFLELLFQMPVLSVTFTEVESWDPNCPLYEELSTATSKRVVYGHGGLRKKNPFKRNPKPKYAG